MDRIICHILIVRPNLINDDKYKYISEASSLKNILLILPFNIIHVGAGSNNDATSAALDYWNLNYIADQN